MFGTILKATDTSSQKGMTFSRNIYVTKVMNLLAFIFEQPSLIYISRPTFAFEFANNKQQSGFPHYLNMQITIQ